MTTNEPGSKGQVLETDELVLHQALTVEPLPSDALLRIRAAVESEWCNQVTPARSRWTAPVFAAAAMVLIVVGVAWFAAVGGPVTDPSSRLGHLKKFAAPGLVERHSLARNRLLRVGAGLYAGQTLYAQGPALISLAGGGNLRIGASTALTVVSNQRVRVTQGVVYFDLPADAAAQRQFVVETLVGDIAHLGTQFEAVVQEDGTRVRVREGAVEWRGTRGATVVAAAGEELQVHRDGTINRRMIATGGREWAWVEALVVDFDIDNQPLVSFLQWMARETGRKLVFADPATIQRATETRMHGSIHGMSMTRALSAVMAATSLDCKISDAEIRVSSSSEKRPTPKPP